MTPASSMKTDGHPKEAAGLPPSLEMQVLRRCQPAAASTADNPPRPEPSQGEASRTRGSPQAIDQAIGEEVGRECDRRLDGWASLEENDRFDTKLLIFCGATLLDDRGIIDKACAKAPELAEEFSELREAGTAGLSNGGNEAASWRTACRRLSALATKAAANAPDGNVLHAVKEATDALERLDSRAILNELQTTVGGFLDDIAEDPLCATVDEEQLADLRGRWGGLAACPSATAGVELQRIQAVFRSDLAALRKLARQHQKAEKELETLRQAEPARGRPRREWEDRRLAGRQKASKLQKERREAEDALLGDLAPSGDLTRAASTAETGDTETAETPSPPRPDGESSEASLLRKEVEDLRNTLSAERRDLKAVRRDRDTLRGKLGRANHELSSLRSRRPQSQGGDGAVDSGSFLKLAARKEEPAPLECIEAIAQAFGDRCVVLDTARASAEQMALFRHGRKLLQLLLTLVTEYRDQLMSGGDAEARRLFGNHYAAKESSTVNGNPELRRHRIFRHEGRDVEMFQHLKIGARADQRQTLRVHFAWDGGSRRILIGHCGKHLPRLKES